MNQLTQRDGDEVVARIRKNMGWIRPRIGKDPLANDVERYYEMFYSGQEPGSLALLNQALNAVERAQAGGAVNGDSTKG